MEVLWAKEAEWKAEGTKVCACVLQGAVQGKAVRVWHSGAGSMHGGPQKASGQGRA